MQSLNNIILFAMAIEIMHCTRDIPTAELSYEQNILSPNKIAENLSCPQERSKMFSWCNELFSRAHYRYYLKVFSSQLGFESSELKCQPELITFVSNPERFPTDRTEFMLSCFGRHEPIRTNPRIDDYYDKFLLAATPDEKIFYVFAAQRLGQGHVFKLYEEILDMTSPIPNALPREEDQSRETLLLTIPTINSWANTVERIYLNEVIVPNKPIKDTLQGIQPNELNLLCVFLLTSASYGTEIFMVDTKRLHQWDKKPGFINLYFDHEDESHNGTQQMSYPCYGRHYSGKTTDNQKLMNLYRISSGPRENSIMVYIHLSYQRDYKFRRIHENINLKGLLAAGPHDPRVEEAGPSEPAAKRIRTGQIGPPDILHPLPLQSIAPSHTPASQLVMPAREQRHRFQRTDEPSPNQSLVYSSPTAGQRLASSQLWPAHQIPSRDQPIQAAGLPYQTSTASQQLTPSPIGSSHLVLNPDPLQFAFQAEGLPYQTRTTGQQLTPPEVGSSYPVPSQDQQPVIPKVGQSILSPDKQLEAQIGGYSSAFQSTDETDQPLSFEDYGVDYFTEISDRQPSAGEGGLLSDVLKQFSKNDPGPSEDP